MPRRVVLAPDAIRQLRALRAADRALLAAAIRTHLIEADATEPTRNRFHLRRPSEVADFELRVGDFRVFYRVIDDDVQVVLIGEKRGNALFIDGKRFIL